MHFVFMALEISILGKEISISQVRKRDLYVSVSVQVL